MLRKNYLLIIFLLLFSTSACAYVQNEKLWLALGANRKLSEDGKWRYLLISQARFINESEPWQSLYLEGGIGNVLNQQVTLWAGYRFVERDPNDGFNPENRLFQQVVARFQLSNSNEFVYRARLEETQIRSASDIALRFRNRFSWSHNEPVLPHLEPFIYEEVFTQLNRASFTPDSFFTENRIFLGFNYRLPEREWIELGYLNQFLIHQRNQTNNTMSHVIVMTYNL